MTKRRAAWAGAAAVGLLLLWCAGTPRKSDQFDRVAVGMSEEEVEAACGPGAFLFDVNGGRVAWWGGHDREMLVRFGADGRVAEKEVHARRAAPWWYPLSGPVEAARQRLGL